MSSQLDLDQGGTQRQYQRLWMGPSIGWIEVPQSSLLSITSAGSFSILRSTNVILVNVNGSVTLNLPSAKSSAAGQAVIPGLAVDNRIVIIDIGGFAQANPITINPSLTETIDGLASIQMISNYGVFVLRPLLTAGLWNLMQ